MVDPVVLFYFGCLSVAVLLAIKSGDDVLQKIAATLFAGWGFFNPLVLIVSPGGLIWWNIGLDVMLLAYVVSLHYRFGSRAAVIVSRLFWAMLVWHFVELVAPTGWYLRGLNVLFLAQLVTVAGFSSYTWAHHEKQHPRPPQSGVEFSEADVLPWPTNHNNHTTRRPSPPG